MNYEECHEALTTITIISDTKLYGILDLLEALVSCDEGSRYKVLDQVKQTGGSEH